MKALVTGATGFVAPYLINRLLKNKYQVVGLYNSVAPENNRFDDSVNLKKCDVTDKSSILKILKDEQPDVVFHLAAISSVSEVKSSYTKSLAVNVASVDYIYDGLLACAEDTGKEKRFLFTSSSEVYGKVNPDTLVDENCEVKPRSLYGLTKQMAETSLQYRFDTDKSNLVRCILVRPFKPLWVRSKSNICYSGVCQTVC